MAEMEACMPYREYIEWLVYFNTGGASADPPEAAGKSRCKSCACFPKYRN